MPGYVVRYGAMRSLGVFSVRGKSVGYRRGDRVVARTPRGLEVCDVLCEAAEDGGDSPPGDQGEILRLMTPHDANELAHIEAETDKEFAVSRRHVQDLELEMELVDLEHLFGGERVVIYYLSESRVDFRNLVRLLAKEFQTRIEMRQIGVRDEAKLLADYGDCGKPVCCNTHLLQMPPVSMKMAKIQKATLDPTKISGRCGRLKCCLRYEYDTYTELARQLPPIGADIVTKTGKARVLAHEIIAEQVLVETEDMRRILIDVADVLTILRDPRKSKPKSRKNESEDLSADDEPE
ncbi:MAG TPA: regulatory iron-sulfur-containing complex subunit RicT [Pirellulaceae bacterium]